MIPEGTPIAYGALERGVPIHAADGPRLGTVEAVGENTKEHIFDGIVMRAEATGEMLWIDAPEVRRITDLAVTTTFDYADAPRWIVPYRQGAPEYRANPRVGRLGRFFGGGWKKK